MSILNMIGWDMYPGQANASEQPVLRAGIDNTPYASLLRVNRSEDARLFLGVSGLPQHKLGVGANARNGLLIRRALSGAAAVLRNAIVFPSRTAPVAVNVPWSLSFASTIKILPETDTRNQNYTLFYLTATTTVNYYTNLLSIARNGLTGPFSLYVASTPIATATYTLEANREYHIEFKLYRAPAVNAFNLIVRIDGEQVYNGSLITNANWATTGYGIAVGMAETVNALMGGAILYGDLVMADDQGTSFNPDIGPTIILPNQVTAVTPGEWEKEGTALPIPTLSDLSDATYYTSPLTDSALQVKLDATPSQYKPLATEVYVRCARDRDAGRQLMASVRGANDVELTPNQSIGTTTNQLDYRLTRVEGASAADMRTNTVRLKAVTP